MQLKTNSACWRPYSEDARSFKLSAKNKRLIKQRRTLTSSSNRLWPFTQFMKIITRDIHNTQLSKMQHPWLMAMIYRRRNWHKLQSKHTMISRPKYRRLSKSYSHKALKLLCKDRSHSFPRSTEHVYTSLAYCKDLWKIFWIVKAWSLVLRTGRKPHWVSSSFASIISRLFVNALGIHFSMLLIKRVHCIIFIRPHMYLDKLFAPFAK